MTLNEIKEKCPPRITIQVAAEIMGVTPRFLQIALQQEKFPFGVGVEMDRWVYYINTKKFLEYLGQNPQ